MVIRLSKSSNIIKTTLKVTNDLLDMFSTLKIFSLAKKQPNNMSLSVQQLVVKLLNFNGTNVKSFYVKSTGECLIVSNAYKAMDYDCKAGIQARQWLLKEKYKM